jgi:hypothetical protein
MVASKYVEPTSYERVAGSAIPGMARSQETIGCRLRKLQLSDLPKADLQVQLLIDGCQVLGTYGFSQGQCAPDVNVERT